MGANLQPRSDGLPRKQLKCELRPADDDRKILSPDAADTIATALQRAQLSRKEAAYAMGISEGQLSRQLAGVEHVSVYRLWRLSTDFWFEWLAVAAEKKRVGTEYRQVVLQVSRCANG